MGKRGLEDSDPIARVRYGSSAVTGSDGTCGYELEDGNRFVETRRPLLSKTHGRRNVDNAPNGDFAIGDEGFDEGFSATETRLPVDGAGVVGFGVGTEPSEFDPLAGKNRSVFPGGKRDGVAEFREVEKTHVTCGKRKLKLEA